MSAYEFREKMHSRQAVRNPPRGLVGESCAMYHYRVHFAAASLVAEGAGACIPGADCSSTTTRGEASAWQQVERHINRAHSVSAAAAAAAAAATAAGRSWRGQTWVDASWSYFMFRQHRGAEGNV